MAKKPLSEILGGETRFGRLTVLREVDGIPVPGNGTSRQVLCRCDCGVEKVFHLQNVKRGLSLSCGCLMVEVNRQLRTTHGDSRCRETGAIAPEYRVWAHMIGRCHNENDGSYEAYGGRGIYVCDRWRYSYENFLADMGRRPSDEHQIDRTDNDGPYEPGNCQWVTFDEQCRNKRTNRWVTVDGKRMVLKDAAALAGMDYRKLQARLDLGWSVKRALSQP